MRILRNILVPLLAVIMLSACVSIDAPKAEGTYEGMTVESATHREGCFRHCVYSVTLSSGNQTVDMDVRNKSLYRLMKQGNIVDVDYDSDHEIIKVRFPDLEGDSKDE